MKRLVMLLTVMVIHQLRSPPTDYWEQSINTDLDLVLNDEVYVIVRQAVSANLKISADTYQTYFSGRLVIKL